MRFVPGKPLLRISWKWNRALHTNSFISFRGTSHSSKCPILALPFWTLILSFFITFFHVCTFHLLCSCLMKVWSKFLVKLTTFIKNALGLKDNGTSALLLDDTMFAISFDLYCGTVNSRGKKKKKWKKKKLPGLYALNLATQDDTILKYNHYFFISATHKKQINYKLYELIIIKWSNFFKWPVRFIFFP